MLSAAAASEHHEIAVCEGQITHARARGAEDVVQRRQRNLEREQRTLAQVQQATESLAREGATLGQASARA